MKFVQRSSSQYLLILKYLIEKNHLECDFMNYLEDYFPPDPSSLKLLKLLKR